MNTNLTLIIPTKLEAESLPIFLNELKYYKFKKLIVLQKDDMETQKAISNIDGIDIIIQKKKGFGRALIEGIEATKTEYCCIINADGSMDPKYLEEMLNKCKVYDLVFCSRYDKGGGSDDDDIVTYIGNKIFTFIGKFFFKLNITDILFTYILGKTSSFRLLKLSYYDFRICVEIPIKAKKNNISCTNIPSYERSRIGGKKKVNAIKDGMLILFAMFNFFLINIFKK